jgi:hypothetical protein
MCSTPLKNMQLGRKKQQFYGRYKVDYQEILNFMLTRIKNKLSVSIVSDYGLDDRGSIPDRGSGFFLKPLHPDRLLGPPSLLYNGYRGSFPRG